MDAQQEKNCYFWILFSLIWIGWGIIGLFLTWLELFFGWILPIYFLIAAFFLTKYCRKHQIFFDRNHAIVLAAIFLISAIFHLNTAPTVFSGRDQGSISEAAIRLSDNHQLPFSTPASQEFFKIYGPGKALNFPGFHYQPNGDLATQFPIAYIAWLASFYTLFGLFGFTVANTILLGAFAMSFFLVASLILRGKLTPYLALTLPFIATAIFWFSRMTLSENLAAPLLWTAILSLMLFHKSSDKLFFWSLAASLFLLIFTRIEGYAFLIMSVALLATQREKMKVFVQQNSRPLIAACAVFVFAIAFDFFSHSQFYREVIKGFLGFLSKNNQLYSPKNYSQNFIYFSSVYFAYGLLAYLFLGFFGIISSIRSKNILALIPVIIIVPTFIYLIDPRISSDHPWLLRRFSFALLPVFILYSVYFLDKISKKTFFGLVIGSAFILLIIQNNFYSFRHFFNYSENHSLIRETEKLSRKFTGNDLILVDRMAAGNGWSMLSGPLSFLFGKNAVYFFNAQDYEKIDRSAFDNVFLIAPDEKIGLYQAGLAGKEMEKFEEYRIFTNQLNTDQSKNPVWLHNFPEKENITVTGVIYKLK